MPMNPALLRPRALQGIPIYLARLGMKGLFFNNNGSSMTSGATAHSVGAYVQFLTNAQVSAADTIVCLHLQIIGNNQATGVDNSALLDIAIGASGSEALIAEGIAVGGGVNSGGTGVMLSVPVRIPGATRVAMRFRCAQATRVYTVQTIMFSGEIENSKFADALPSVVEVIGTNPATSAGVALSGASGTFVEITPSTAKDYQALVLVPSAPQDTTGGTTDVVTLELAIGAAGSEKVCAHCVVTVTSVGALGQNPFNHVTACFGGLIPAGSRLSVRHNQAASPGRLAACVIGVPFQ